MPVPQTLLFMVWGLLLGRLRVGAIASTTVSVYEAEQSNVVVRGWVTLRYLGMLVIVVVALCGLYWYLSYAADLFLQLDPTEPAKYGPRFWEIGARLSDFD